MNHCLCARLPYTPRRARVGLLAGSFNPAHAGHLALSQFARQRLKLHVIWWLVAPQNPLKSAQDMAPLPERLRQARQLSGWARLKVIAPEADWNTRYTISMLRQLRRCRATTRFVLLLGDDNWHQLPQWYLWHAIMHAVPIAVLRRHAYGKTHAGACEARARYAFAQRPFRHAGDLASQMPPAWTMADNPYWAISATMIRNQHRSRSI